MDNLWEEYNAVCKAIKALEARKDELKVQLMACNGESTDHFMVKVSTIKQERLESLKAIKSKSLSLHKALFEAGCVKEIEMTRLTVKALTKS